MLAPLRHLYRTGAVLLIASAGTIAPSRALGPSADEYELVPAQGPQRARLEVGEDHAALTDENLQLNEPHLAVNPNDPDHMVVAAIVGDVVRQRVTTAHSLDGGSSWQRVELPGSEDISHAGDPWLAWGRGGDVTLSLLTIVSDSGRERLAVWVYSSPDGGATWSGPSEVPTGPARGSYDHDILLAVEEDPEGGGGGLTIVATYGLSGLAIAHKDADGLWQAPDIFTPDERNNNLGGAARIGNDVVFTYFDMTAPAPERPLWAVRSERGGRFTRTLIRRGVVPWGFPPLAAHPRSTSWRGRLHAVWVERDETSAGLHIHTAHSDDLGQSWSDPVRVDSDTTSTFRGHPAVTVSQDGTVGIQWNDRRSSPDTECSEIYFSASFDGGETFEPEVPVSSAASCPDTASNGRNAERWPSGGDYQGLVADSRGNFRSAWSDTRRGRFEIWTTTVEVVRR